MVYILLNVLMNTKNSALGEICSTSEPWRFIFAFLQNSLKEMSLVT